MSGLAPRGRVLLRRFACGRGGSERGSDGGSVRATEPVLLVLNLRRTLLMLGFAALLPSEASAQSVGSLAEPGATEPASRSVFVHLDGEADLELRRLGGRFGKHLCFAPCDTELELDRAARLELRGGPTLPAFSLEPGKAYALRIDGNKALATTGFATATLGFSTLTATSFGFLFNALVAGAYGDEVPEGRVVAFSAIMGSGALLFAIGLPIALAYEPEVVVDDRGPVGVRAKGTALRFDARGMGFEF
jgi:hypothetical protein